MLTLIKCLFLLQLLGSWELCGFHIAVSYDCDSFLGCSAVQWGRQVPMFIGNLPYPSSWTQKTEFVHTFIMVPF